MRFEIEKINGKVKIEFQVEGLNQYDELSINYRCSQFDKTPRGDWFFNAKYNEHKQAITFSPKSIEGKKIDGVSVTPDVAEKLKSLKATFIEERKAEISRVEGYFPQTICWAIKGNSHEVVVTTDEIDTRLAQPRVFKELKTIIGRNIAEMAKISIEVERNSSLYTMGGWYKLEVSKICSFLKEEERKEQEKEEKKLAIERVKAEMTVKVLSRTTEGDDDDVTVKVAVTDNETSESGIFYCRNIFDFGYVVNPEAGGILIGDRWDVGDKPRPATPFEKKAVAYLTVFPPISAAMRM